MFLRTPLRKKLTQNRAWKPVFVRLCVEEKDGTARIHVYTQRSLRGHASGSAPHATGSGVSPP